MYFFFLRKKVKTPSITNERGGEKEIIYVAQLAFECPRIPEGR